MRLLPFWIGMIIGKLICYWTGLSTVSDIIEWCFGGLLMMVFALVVYRKARFDN